MTDRNKSEISPQKRSLKLAPMLGDWTTYKPPQNLIKKVKTGLYGFDRLSEDELKTAHLLHYVAAQKFCELVKSTFKVGSELYLVDAQQNTYSSFFNSFSLPILQCKIISSNFNDEVFLSFDLSLIDTLINASLGSQDISKLNRGLSEAEEIIADEILQDIAPLFLGIFQDTLQSQKLTKVGAPNIVQNQGIPEQSTFVHFTIEVSLNNVIGKIVLGYSGTFIKTLLKQLGQKVKKPNLALSKLHPSIFSIVKSPVSVKLGVTNLNMSEIQGLEVGDVITFEQSIDSAIPISLSHGHSILGQPGIKNGKTAVKVVAIGKDKAVKIEPPAYALQDEEDPDSGDNPEENVVDEEPIEEDFENTQKEGNDELKFEDDEFSDEDLEGLLDEEEPKESNLGKEEKKEE